MQLLPGTMKRKPWPSKVRRAASRIGVAYAALLLSVSGCASVGGRLVADHDEYVAYRNVRTSDRLDGRLVASHAYLKAYPEGRWATEVEPWFARAELRYWLRIKETPAGLATYLENLPDGPHAVEAAGALRDYRERQRAARKELLDLEAAMTEERLAELQRQRQAALESFTSWLGRFLSVDTWGERTSHLDHETIFAWRIDPPKGRCEADLCTKIEQRPYELPGGGDQSERRLVMEVVLVLEQGMLRETRLQGPGLFSRLYETASNKPVEHDDPGARVEAIAYAVDVVGGAAEARMPAGECAEQPVAPIVLKRACKGWTLEAVAGERAGQDDVVSISGPPR